ncbi:MAG: hypothetical protein IJ511_05570 [Bacteroides sp.]|nr:hypothetical protein [Bacteroides sp.]
MRRRAYIQPLIALLLTLLLMLLPTACSESEEAVAMPDDERKVTVHIVLSTGLPAASSHTRASAIYDAGTPAEYWIDPYDMEVLVYDAAGNYVQRAVISRVSPVDETNSPGLYTLTGSISNITAGGSYRLVALCNLNGALTVTHADGTAFTPTRLEGGTLDGLIADLRFAYNANYSAGLLTASTAEQTRIPMWGTAPSVLNDGVFIEIDVLRAMSKVRVTLDSSVSGVQLSGVSLTTANAGGFLAAQGGQAVITAANVTAGAPKAAGHTNRNSRNADDSGDYTGIPLPSVSGFTPLMQSDNTTPATLAFTRSDDDGDGVESFIIYVPEYANLTHDTDGNVTGRTAQQAYMTLSFTDDEGEALTLQRPYLYFADYSNSATTPVTQNEWDIIRNDFYDYTITGVTTGRLQARVSVQPWEVDNMDYTLSQKQAVDLMGVTGSTVTYDSKSGSRGFATTYDAAYDASTSQYATFRVKVTDPQGVRWMALLSDSYHFELVTPFNESSCSAVDAGYADANEEFTIMVRPRFEAGTTVRTTQLYFTIETLLNGAKAQINVPRATDDTTSGSDTSSSHVGIEDVVTTVTENNETVTTFTTAGQAYMQTYALDMKWQQIQIVQQANNE